MHPRPAGASLWLHPGICGRLLCLDSSSRERERERERERQWRQDEVKVCTNVKMWNTPSVGSSSIIGNILILSTSTSNFSIAYPIRTSFINIS